MKVKIRINRYFRWFACWRFRFTDGSRCTTYILTWLRLDLDWPPHPVQKGQQS